MERRWEIDALRGLMLVLMTLTHWPTRLSDPSGQPFGFVSAAEGFVLLSAFMAGAVYAQRALRQGDEAMREAFWQRALKIYLCQAALLLFLFTFVVAVGLLKHEGAITGLASFYLDRPGTAVIAALLLLYNPPLLDILPMYIVFMLASPWLLGWGLHRGWGAILALSAAAWAGSQFGLGRALQAEVIAFTGLALPPQQGGAFDILSWQLVWVIGLWLGASDAAQRPALPARWPRAVVLAAIAIGLAGFVWRHAVGQLPFPVLPATALPNLLFDKWRLGPARLLDLFALLVLLLHFRTWLAHHLPRLRVLETLGSASLPVFCAHLVVALLALAFIGPSDPGRPWWIDATLMVLGFALLYAVARISQHVDEQAARLQQRLKARRAARAGRPADAPRSPTSTAHSPPR